jgi:triosephosphate isomerase
VGHSERREHHHEDDSLINAKVVAAFRNGLTPILCVGESLAVRESGDHVGHCHAQLDNGLAGLPAEQVQSIVIAYEPIWAIGTGKVATPEDAQEVCGAIRGWLAEHHGQAVADQVRVLYGGSVKANNVASIMDKPDVDGALVGGASLNVDEFSAIARFYDLPAL